jgi:hypothetical protein
MMWKILSWFSMSEAGGVEDDRSEEVREGGADSVDGHCLDALGLGRRLEVSARARHRPDQSGRLRAGGVG